MVEFLTKNSMYDRTDFNQVIEEKLRNIGILVEEAKGEGRDSILFPFFIPNDKRKHFEGFKGEIIAKLKEKDYHVTNFLPDFKPSFNGVIKEIFIAWSDAGRKTGEASGYEFK